MNKQLGSIASILIVLAIGPITLKPLTALVAQTQKLAAQGPWIVFSKLDEFRNSNGLWVANQDGSAPTELVKGTTIGSSAPSSKGGYVAYVSAEYPADGVELIKTKLNLLHIPDGQITLDFGQKLA